MNMKTLLSIVILLAFGVTHAQKVYGIYCGVNVNSIHNKSGGTENYGSLPSFHVGVMTNIPFNMFSLHTGLLVTGKGGVVIYGDRNSQGDYLVAETNPFYLEIPATFNLNLRFSDHSGWYIGAGPYAAIGIGGTNRVYGRYDGNDFGFNENVSFDNTTNTPPEEGGVYSSLNRVDVGVRFNTGVFLTRLHVAAFFERGLTQLNRLSNLEHDDNLRLGTLGFTVGFVFGGCDKYGNSY